MRRILHITSNVAWEQAQEAGIYEADTLATEGYIHCSNPEQVVKVANARFLAHTGLVLVVIDENRITAKVKYENLEGGEEKFPHIYGPLNIDAVVEVVPFNPGKEGRFEYPESLQIP